MHDEAKAVLKAQIESHKSMIERFEADNEKLRRSMQWNAQQIERFESRIIEVKSSLDQLHVVPSKPFAVSGVG